MPVLEARLAEYYAQVDAIILSRQHPVTGLLPASTAVTTHGDYRDAWVRDNVYSILCVWGLGLAYRRVDSPEGRSFLLERRTVKLMRGLLRSMMAQSAKVEAFKKSRHPADALHAKYDTETGGTAVGDLEWGHLQIDATSLYLLMLAQMIRSGLDIIWDLDEVAFIQNLVYYVERAYRTPDYGIWERGEKSNRGRVELNTSSVGMAKAALEALAGFDLFGARGSQRSVIHVSPDNIAQAELTLRSMLPRESYTKEVDAALLSVIGYPAFALDDAALIRSVRDELVKKLEGRYGLKRFLRDGHQTAVEDEGRLHYEEAELKQFENIESEWPLFFTYLFLDAHQRGDRDRQEHYAARLEALTVEQNGHRMLPELYYVPADQIEAERAVPGSTERVPNENVPLVWAQSLYLLGRMLADGALRWADIDPLARRRIRRSKNPTVQLVFLAEDEQLQSELAAHGVMTETVADIAPVLVYLPQDIALAHGEVGRSDGLGLSGRSARLLKSLTTSRVYRLAGDTVLCLASFFIQSDFFLAWDLEFVLRRFKDELVYLNRNWTGLGRPTVTVMLTHNLLEASRETFYEFMQQVADGRIAGVPVRRGPLTELLPTASFERISELHGLKLPKTALSSLLDGVRVLSPPGVQRPLEAAQELELEFASDWEELVGRLATSTNLYEQCSVMEALARLRGLDAAVSIRDRARTVRELLLEVYKQAGRLRLWAVVRSVAGLLGMVDGDLSLAVSAILVRQKHIQVGRAYSEDSLITHPIPEHELMQKLAAYCRDDVRDRVLTQELLLYLGSLVKARPELLREMITVRVGQLITLLTSDLARERELSADEAYEALTHLPPSEIQARLYRVLKAWDSLEELPQQQEHLEAEAPVGTLNWQPDRLLEGIGEPTEGWLAWRQYRGIIDRLGADFYEGLWHCFEQAPCVIIGDRMDRRNRMESSVVLGDMTSGEQSFAFWVQHLLNKAPSPEYRQLSVEALQVLITLFRQNPELHVTGPVSVDVLIGHAVKLYFLREHPEAEADYNAAKPQAWEAFVRAGPVETSTALLSALRLLLTVRSTESSLQGLV